MTSPATLGESLAAGLRLLGSRPALGFYSAEDRVDWSSGEDLLDLGLRQAASLARAGVGPGDVCVLTLPSGAACAHLLLGLLLRGALPLLVAPPVIQGLHSDLPRVLANSARKAGARLVVADASTAKQRAALEAALPCPALWLEDGELEPSATPLEEVSSRPPDTLAALQLTSGTTGLPRICAWTHRSVLAALDGMAQAMELGPEDVCFNWTPLYHDMGLVNNFFLCLSRGVPLVLQSPHDFVRKPASWLRGLTRSQATIGWSPNFGFALALRASEAELQGVDLRSVRALYNAAERIHARTLQEFTQRYSPWGLAPEAMKTNFGCAENIGGATFSDPRRPPVVECIDPAALTAGTGATAQPWKGDGAGGWDVVSCGRPHPQLSVAILGEEGEDLPEGQVGRVALATPSRLREYLGDAEATAALEAGHGRVWTGDLGYLRGGEFFWVGRDRERINVHGKKYDPSDFEPILFEISGLRTGSFAAFGVDDPEVGSQRVVLVAEARLPLERSAGEMEREIRRAVTLRLGVHLGAVVLVRPGTLTKTSSGKRRHTYFRQLFEAGGLEAFRVESLSPSPASFRGESPDSSA